MQSHPHILHLYGYIVKDEDYVGILMEYCNGGTLMKGVIVLKCVGDEFFSHRSRRVL